MKNNQKIKKPIKGKVAKVPVVIQLEALECGAACLTMILAYYDKWIPLEQVRSDCGVSRDGSKAKNVLLAARGYGLEASGYRFELEALKESAEFPCIIHWDFNHFVVLCGFKNGKAIINDPARGRVAVTMDVFDRSFTGICLFFKPSEGYEPSGKKKSVVDYAKKRVKGSGTAFALMVITTIIMSLIGIITPAFSNVFADRLLSGTNPEWFVPFMIGISVLTIIEIITAYINTVYSLKVNGKMSLVADSEYMWHVLRLPMRFFSQRMAGDISGRRQENESLVERLVNTFAPLVVEAIMMVFYLVIMIRYSMVLSIVGIISVLINALVASAVSKKRIDVQRVSQRDQGKLDSATVSGIEMIESIKAAGAENGFFEKWSGYQASLYKTTTQSEKIDIYYGIIPTFINSLANAIVFAGSVYLCQRGEWTVGMITAFSGFLMSFMNPAMEFVNAAETLMGMRVDMERIEDVMEYPIDPNCEEKEINDDEELRKLSGKIELKNITFGYSPLEPPLIEDFSMTLERGKKVAFVGPSGCGKSTLSKLISGLYRPWSGEILYDGKPIDEINRGVFTSSVAVVDQDIVLFEDSIAQNIKMWNSSIEDYEMILAAKDAQVYEDIMQRDGGFRGVLTEGGKDLSGGQRQRIEIARTLAMDPTIIVMDEATSALDAKTEYEVVRSIEERGITCVVVAHRLSTIRDCEEIIVLDNGKVVERGTHDELFKNDGLYTQLVSYE